MVNSSVAKLQVPLHCYELRRDDDARRPKAEDPPASAHQPGTCHAEHGPTRNVAQPVAIIVEA
jgi:hypothetical protein